MEPRLTIPAWDDLRSPASAINPAGSAAAATVDQDDGNLVFTNGQTQTVAVLFQMPHAWKVGSTISFHIHWSKTTSASGTVKWQAKYRWYNIGAVKGSFSAFVDLTETVANADTADLHALAETPDWAGTGKTISSMIEVVLQRLSSGGSADTYGAAVKLAEVDLHYQLDGFGSYLELTK